MNNHEQPDVQLYILIQEQIGHEFTAAQQYTAIAVYCDGSDLPQLARFFYKRADEERGHAMMLIQYLLDRNVYVEIPGVNPVRNYFEGPEDALRLLLEEECRVTEQITRLAHVARDEGDYLGEQFIQWFLQEQVEEVSSISTLLNVARRAGKNLFDLENFVAREINTVGSSTEVYTPKIAGQSL